jgi:hypothetical protein
MRCPDDRHSKAADRWIAFLTPIFWEAAFGVATWSVAAYVAILFVASMRPLLERLLLTYAVGAIFTLLMQTYGRFDQCVGIVACTFSLGKGVVWSTIWPVAWIIGPGSELTLTMRLTGHGPGVYKDGIDYGKTSARASRMMFGFSGRCTALC